MAVKDYLRQRFLPQIWCPGCGHGIVMAAMIRAVEELGLNKNQVVAVSGIGCSSRMPGYLDFHTMHTLHGRALAFATGVKLGRPDLTVLAPMGDGDASAIGGNHLIHAARRNIDLTAIILNNSVYGMTGGQTSPTTPRGSISTTSPLGSLDQPFDLVDLAKGAGATFVARGTTFHIKQLQRLLVEAIAHKGFSLVEVLSQCPTYYGRKNKGGSAAEMMKAFDAGTVAADAPGAQESGLVPRGVLVNIERPEYTASYAELVRGLNKSPDQPAKG